MVGFQSFPTKFTDINIEKVNTLKKLYPNTKIGYADHTSFDDNDMEDVDATEWLIDKL